MKILRFVLILWVTFLLSACQSFSYELTDADIDILDAVETKMFDIIDRHETLMPEDVVAYIDSLLQKDTLSQRSRGLLEILADDIEYSYYLWIYADEILTADDCYDDEYFDEDDQRCYVKDDSQSDQTSDFSSEKHSVSEVGSRNEDFLAVYEISQNSITLQEWNDNEQGKLIWNIFAQIIPERNREHFKLYMILDDENSDTGAYVEQDSQDNTRWNMAVNLDAFSYDGELDREYMISTLIHEYAHVLSFNKYQMRYYPVTDNENILDRFAENCSTNLVQEWCMNEDSYLDDFIDIFWSDAQELRKVREEWLDVYTGNEDNFITDYAATNPWEDLAESFAYFVLKPKPEPRTLADKKLLFFYDYKELVTLRNFIRWRLEEIN